MQNTLIKQYICVLSYLDRIEKRKKNETDNQSIDSNSNSDPI